VQKGGGRLKEGPIPRSKISDAHTTLEKELIQGQENNTRKPSSDYGKSGASTENWRQEDQENGKGGEEGARRKTTEIPLRSCQGGRKKKNKGLRCANEQRKKKSGKSKTVILKGFSS